MEPLRYFSDEIEALMGEWLAYSAIDHYFRHTYPEFFPDFQPGDMSQKEMFETVYFETEHDSNLTNSAYLFNRVGIGFDGTVKYEAIRTTIRANIQNFRSSFIEYFGAAYTRSEREYFEIEPGCRPLIDRFIIEGYCTFLNERFFWTSKIRPVFETFGYWESKTVPSKYEDIKASLSPKLIKSLNYYAESNQLILAVKTLRDFKSLDLKTAKLFLEEFMFPEKWGQQKEPFLLRWFGP